MKLDDAAKRIINETKPAFVATADASGQPNVSAKGSTRVFDDEHVLFADVASPRTVSNLKENQKVAVIWLDTTGNQSCRIWGEAEILVSGDAFETLSMEFAERNMKISHAILVRVDALEM
jgi:predicted pyridoxine 5'-phosphate oxidase superfamily flavin-nucleotide-binding protein